MTGYKWTIIYPLRPLTLYAPQECVHMPYN